LLGISATAPLRGRGNHKSIKWKAPDTARPRVLGNRPFVPADAGITSLPNPPVLICGKGWVPAPATPAGGLLGASLCCGHCGDIAAVIAALLRVIARPGHQTSLPSSFVEEGKSARATARATITHG
jgi:hypothetical protein